MSEQKSLVSRVLGAVQKGSPEQAEAAFDTLIDHFYGEVYRTAYRVLHNQEHAKDIAQEAFFAAWKHRAQLKERLLRAWLLRTTFNLSLNWIRSEERRIKWERQSYAESLSDPRRPLPGSERYHREIEQRERLSEAIDALPQTLRTVVILHYLSDLSTEDIAQTMGVKRNTVQQHLKRAKLKLRAFMDGAIQREAP